VADAQRRGRSTHDFAVDGLRCLGNGDAHVA
jgi:hypothetical protein